MPAIVMAAFVNDLNRAIDAQLDDGSVERSLAVERVTVNRLRHSAPLQEPRVLPVALDAPELPSGSQCP